MHTLQMHVGIDKQKNTQFLYSCMQYSWDGWFLKKTENKFLRPPRCWTRTRIRQGAQQEKSHSRGTIDLNRSWTKELVCVMGVRKICRRFQLMFFSLGFSLGLCLMHYWHTFLPNLDNKVAYKSHNILKETTMQVYRCLVLKCCLKKDFFLRFLDWLMSIQVQVCLSNTLFHSFGPMTLRDLSTKVLRTVA